MDKNDPDYNPNWDDPNWIPPAEGWHGSGDPCIKCGTREYFDSSTDDGEPICNDCWRKVIDAENERF